MTTMQHDECATYVEVESALRIRGPVQTPPSPSPRLYPKVMSATCPACERGTLGVYHVAGGLAHLECRPTRCEPVTVLVSLGIDRRPVDPATVDAASSSAAHSGQLRMALGFADAAVDSFKFVHGIGWHYWDDTRWAYDDAGRVNRAVIDVLSTALALALTDGDKELRSDVRKCESATGIRGVLEIASTLPQFAVTVPELDADAYRFNTATGTLDLHTIELASHRPGDLITKVARATYDPYPMGSVWTRFLLDVLPDAEVREYLQRLIGVALIGRVIEHVLPILTGTGANGKSTFVKAVCNALGDYAGVAEPDLMMQRQGAHPTGETDLLGKRLVAVNESENGKSIDAAKMKRLTGGDTIRARKMRQDFFEFEPSHMPLLVTNHLPKVAGDDPAVWRRLRVIPFDVEIPSEDRDPRLDEALQLEADVVLSWAVDGLRDYQDRGGLDEPPAVLVATGNYQQASDAVARFIAEECVTSSAVMKVRARELFHAWDHWRVIDGAEQMSEKAFGQAADRLGYPTEQKRDGAWRQGIRVKTEVDK